MLSTICKVEKLLIAICNFKMTLYLYEHVHVILLKYMHTKTDMYIYTFSKIQYSMFVVNSLSSHISG